MYWLRRPDQYITYHLERVHDDGPPKQLNERTGKHYCVRCLAEVPAEEFLQNDHICNECAQTDEYPLKSTPEAKAEGGRKKDARRRK